jgi:hypothetical protein
VSNSNRLIDWVIEGVLFYGILLSQRAAGTEIWNSVSYDGRMERAAFDLNWAQAYQGKAEPPLWQLNDYG